MSKKVQATTEELNDISIYASDIIQRRAEAVGSLKMIDIALEDDEKRFQSDMIWALRNAIRNIEATTADAFNITEKIETFEEIK